MAGVLPAKFEIQGDQCIFPGLAPNDDVEHKLLIFAVKPVHLRRFSQQNELGENLQQ
jgi:hypothetical protein